MWGQLPFLSVADTAAAAGIKPGTAYDWKRDDQAFWQACEESRNGTVERLIQEAMDGLRGEMAAVMREKIRLATAAEHESVRDSASTWLLECVLGRAKSRLDVTSGDKALEGLLSALAVPIEPKVEPRPDDSEFEDP
jgi:hypothetical protein